VSAPAGLSGPEQRMWDAFPYGANVDFRTGSTEDDPRYGDRWGTSRQVRAEILARLLCGEVTIPPGHIGSVRLVGARIIGDVLLQDVEVKHSLWLEACHVAGTIDLTEAATRSLQLDNCHLGLIRMIGTTITGFLSLRGSHLHGYEGLAFQADMATVSGALLCDGEFTADGTITLPGVRVGGQTSFSGARLISGGRYALMADRITTQDLFLDADFKADGMVSLAYANVGVMQDSENSWPESLNVDGFVYDDLQPYLPAVTRLKWICRSTGYLEQPYEQLAAYYRKLGNDEQARIVLLAKQRQRRRQQPWWLRWWGWIQDGLVGYGYAPGRALIWLVAAFITGCIYFSENHPSPAGGGLHQTFYAPLYTINALIPILGISQPGTWNPGGAGLYVTAALRVLGWLLAVTIVAAITRSLSRH
jgi:hypothetical protein